MAWSVVRFGKHTGKTLPQIVFADPDWFFWAHEGDVLKKRQSAALAAEAEAIRKKAHAIRIPGKGPGQPLRHAEYIFDRLSGKFSQLRIVPASRSRHVAASKTVRLPVIDLGIVRANRPYDKLGNALLMADVKQILFCNRHWRMTRQRCEQFFDDPNHFEL